MISSLPTLIVTGASGFVGRHLLEAAKRDYRIFAFARRSQRAAGVPAHPNVHWVQVDIANWQALKTVMQNIKEQGSADVIIHLAAYYDFANTSHPELLRTNVNGTRHMLEQAKWLGVRDFIFGSSIAVSEFPPLGGRISETSPPDADFPYARSKRQGELMVKEYSAWFGTTILRLTAVFSDWCEYAPLYKFLDVWLGRSRTSRILGGRGRSAIPYIHVDDVTDLLLTLLHRLHDLPPHRVYIASPDTPVSHRELFEIATRHYFGRTIPPVCLPKLLVGPGIALRRALGFLMRSPPFERLWMLKYVDRVLAVDASWSRNTLDWEPRARRGIKRRLLFLVERMKAEPHVWHAKNEAAVERGAARPSLLIHEGLQAIKERVLARMVDHLLEANRDLFPHYQLLDRPVLRWAFDLVYQLLSAAVRTGDRMLMLDYISDLCRLRFEQGFDCSEVCRAVRSLGDIVAQELRARPELRGLEDSIYDQVTLTIRLALDEIEDVHDLLFGPERTRRIAGRRAELRSRPDRAELETTIRQLESIYRPAEARHHES